MKTILRLKAKFWQRSKSWWKYITWWYCSQTGKIKNKEETQSHCQICLQKNEKQYY